jgi:hypothetical protein
MPVQSQSNALILKKTDGTDQSISFPKLKKITFSGTNLVLNYQADTAESVALSSIRKMTFGTYTSVESVEGNIVDFVIYPNPATDFIFVKTGLVAKTKVVIYSLSGMQLMTATLSYGNERIDVRNLQKGMYILKLDNQAFKFTKQ